MNLFFWKNNKMHDEFASSLADDFINNYPPSEDKNMHDKKRAQKFNKVTNRIYNQAGDYSSKVKLGVYSRARIGNKFMWALKEKGYEDLLIEELTTNLLRALNKKVSI